MEQFNLSHLVQIFLNQEHEQFVQSYPEYKEFFEDLEEKFNKLEEKIKIIYKDLEKIKTDKEFAEVANYYPYKSVLFKLRHKQSSDIKNGIRQLSPEVLIKYWKLTSLE